MSKLLNSMKSATIFWRLKWSEFWRQTVFCVNHQGGVGGLNYLPHASISFRTPRPHTWWCTQTLFCQAVLASKKWCLPFFMIFGWITKFVVIGRRISKQLTETLPRHFSLKGLDNTQFLSYWVMFLRNLSKSVKN